MIIISGASGFIGRRLAARLVAERPDADLRCLVKAGDDSFGQAGVEFLSSRGIRPQPAELRDGTGLEGLQSPALAFHLAANTHTWERDHTCNDLGTENLLRAMSPLGPRNHIVFTSTIAVMDNRTNLGEPLAASFNVGRPPLSAYGRSKWRAEEFLRAQAKCLGFRLSIVRLCTVYGPHPRPNTLFEVLKREVERRTLASRLDWPGLTSFIHVDDVVTCLLKIANDPPEPGEPRAFLLATESKTLSEVARLLYRTRGLPYQIIRLPPRAWDLLRHTHEVCRHSANTLPVSLFNWLWRFDMVVNPVFHCDTQAMGKWFPNLAPRPMTDCIEGI